MHKMSSYLKYCRCRLNMQCGRMCKYLLLYCQTYQTGKFKHIHQKSRIGLYYKNYSYFTNCHSILCNFSCKLHIFRHYFQNNWMGKQSYKSLIINLSNFHYCRFSSWFLEVPDMFYIEYGKFYILNQSHHCMCQLGKFKHTKNCINIGLIRNSNN